MNGKITVGMELEAVTLRDNAHLTDLVTARGWAKRHDATILDSYGQPFPSNSSMQGKELTSPIMTCGYTVTDNSISVNNADIIDAVVRCTSAVSEINKTCGFHLHFGKPKSDVDLSSKWTPEKVRALLAFCQLYEDRLYDVCPASRKNNTYCKRIRESFTKAELSGYDPIGKVKPRKMQNPKRYCWVNIIETKRKGTDPRIGYQAGPATGTLEIRLLGNTKDVNYIMPWTYFWLKVFAALAAYSTSQFMLCAMNGTFDEEYLSLKLAKDKHDIEPDDLPNVQRLNDDALPMRTTRRPRRRSNTSSLNPA